MNSEALKYLSLLSSGTPGQIYLVGGPVRDLLLGKPDIKDFDLLMQTGSEEAARQFSESIDASFFFLDEERRITRVIKKDKTGDIQFDFTNFEGADLSADLGRRDFTINAMALDLRKFLETGSAAGVIDLFQGRRDLDQGLIRITGPGVLQDDPLRMLRAVRFAATHGFAIDAETRDAIRRQAPSVVHAAPERIRDEFFPILASSGAFGHLLLMDDLGLLTCLLPELDELKGFTPGMYHAYDVRTHSLKAVEHLDGVMNDLWRLSPEHADRVLLHLDQELEHFVARKAALRFACLLHDIAKPETFSRDEKGHIHFYGHDNLGAVKAKSACNRFRLSRQSEAVITSVIKQHMRLFNLSSPGGPSKNAMYRYCRDVGAALPESLLLSQADARATVDVMPREKFLDTEKPMATVLAYYYDKYLKVEEKPLLTGRDLINLGLRPGPNFRQLLDDIKERQAAGILKDRKDALEYIKSLQ